MNLRWPIVWMAAMWIRSNRTHSERKPHKLARFVHSPGEGVIKTTQNLFIWLYFWGAGIIFVRISHRPLLQWQALVEMTLSKSIYIRKSRNIWWQDVVKFFLKHGQLMQALILFFGLLTSACCFCSLPFSLICPHRVWPEEEEALHLSKMAVSRLRHPTCFFTCSALLLILVSINGKHTSTHWGCVVLMRWEQFC